MVHVGSTPADGISNLLYFLEISIMSDLTTLFAQADAIGSKYQTEAEVKAHRDRMAKVLAELDAIMDEEAAKVEQEC